VSNCWIIPKVKLKYCNLKYCSTDFGLINRLNSSLTNRIFIQAIKLKLCGQSRGEANASMHLFIAYYDCPVAKICCNELWT
jgi:hypothetical protein